MPSSSLPCDAAASGAVLPAASGPYAGAFSRRAEAGTVYPAHPAYRARPENLASLREAVRRIEGGQMAAGAPGTSGGAQAAGLSGLLTGIAALDAALPPQGLACGAVHEIGGDRVAATSFALQAGARLAWRSGRPLVWLVLAPSSAGQGNAAHGRFWPGGVIGPAGGVDPATGRIALAPDQLIMVQVQDQTALLRAAEEILRDNAVAALVAESAAIAMARARRLQLAASDSGVTGLFLDAGAQNARRSDAGAGAGDARAPPLLGTAASRWAVSCIPDDGTGAAGWRLEILRVRGGRPATAMADPARLFCMPDQSRARLICPRTPNT